MNIAPQPPASASQRTTAASPGSDGTAGKAMISSDFETFLTMLSVQMQNQDPLNPMESTEFATQLATFSSVEQQVLTNDLLIGLAEQMSALGVSQLSGWVGMTARADMPVNFDGSPVTITTRVADGADAAELVVRDRLGNEVQRLAIDPSRQETEWAGVDEQGAPLPSGTYTLTVESFANGDPVGSEPVFVHARIVEARNEDGTPLLVMDSGQVVHAGAVVGLRAAD